MTLKTRKFDIAARTKGLTDLSEVMEALGLRFSLQQAA